MLNQIDLSRIDLNLLVLFEAVIEERHVGRTASRMNLTPSAISHGLNRLRKLFGDPLFLRTPRGVVPTERAEDLRAPIADALLKLRAILAPPEPFDPASSQRRFLIGAPDGISAVILPLLLARLRATPGIRVGFRELLPDPGERLPERAWQSSFAALDARSIDLAILPVEPIPARFHAEALYEEDFVVAMRAGHPIAAAMSLDRYCRAHHLLVSQSGDADGFVDAILADAGRERSVVATVPNFMLALAALSDGDLIAALPRRLVALHGKRFGLIGVEPPLPLGTFGLNGVVPKVAMGDRGVAWLVGVLGALVSDAAARPQRV